MTIATHEECDGAEAVSELEGMVEFTDNPEPRCPCVLLLDISNSMAGSRINSMNAGIRSFKEEACKDLLTSRRAEIALVTFNHRYQVVQDFVTVNDFDPPTLRTNGGTNISGAIRKALEMLDERKRAYRANSIAYFRAICILITDGQPQNDDPNTLAQVADEILQAENGRHLAFFTFAVDGADMNVLTNIAPPARPPLPLPEAQIEDIFSWLSSSVSMISQSQPGDTLQLPHPKDYVNF